MKPAVCMYVCLQCIHVLKMPVESSQRRSLAGVAVSCAVCGEPVLGTEEKSNGTTPSFSRIRVSTGPGGLSNRGTKHEKGLDCTTQAQA